MPWSESEEVELRLGTAFDILQRYPMLGALGSELIAGYPHIDGFQILQRIGALLLIQSDRKLDHFKAVHFRIY